MDNFLQLSLSGIMTGSIYSLVALGFVLIFKSSKIFNLAQGGLVLLGAYLFYAFFVQLEFPLWLSILATMAVMAVLAIGLERWPLRPLIGQPLLALVMVTIALLLVLEGITSLVWGDKGWITYPEFIPAAAWHIGNIGLSQGPVWTFIVCMGLAAIFILFFRFSRTGLVMRAVGEEQQLAQSQGMSVSRVIAVSWVIAGVVAAFGGIFLGSINGISQGLSAIGLKALPAALLGGLESIPGAIIGGLAIGLIESLAAGYIGMGIKEVAAFIVMILILVIRPYGLFGYEEIERV